MQLSSPIQMTATNHFNLTIPQIQIQIQIKPRNTRSERAITLVSRTNLKLPSLFIIANRHVRYFKPRNCACRSLGDSDATTQNSAVSDTDSSHGSLSSSSETYLPLLIRMLGLDNDQLDRDQAVISLWKYSLGGKHFVDNIMQFRGCVNLTVNLLRSESSNACEAAAGLLRMISSINSYRDIVADSGAVEETTALLRRPSLTSEVKEQSICMLWNISTDERHRVKIANFSLLPLLIKFLDDEDIRVVEAAGGVLANLALSPSTHSITVEAGVIPKMSKFLTNEVEGSKVIRKEAKNVLLELAKDDYYKILIVEEGLVLVPLVGSAAYASFKPAVHSFPSLPDGTELKRSSIPSRFGATELLLGLNVEENNDNMDELKANAIVGRTQQQFLARIGAIEAEKENKSQGGSYTSPHQTLLPLKDGVARLVLILELEDESAMARAIDAIAGASVNEGMRTAFKEAGAVKHLVRLIKHDNHAVISAVVNALEKLSVSNAVCRTMEAEGITHPLVNIVKDIKTTDGLMEKTLSILARILDPNKKMKLKFYDGPVNGSISDNGASISSGNIEEMKDFLDSTLVVRLIDIFKSGSLSLQAKVASILEFLTTIEPCLEAIIATDIESVLMAIFEQNLPEGSDLDDQESDYASLEEAGLAISSSSRLLTRLLDYQQFHDIMDSNHFTTLLRKILKSNIHIRHKDWVAACLVRLSSIYSPFENPITTEVTLYEKIPRLIEQMKTSFSLNVQEAAVVELNQIISEDVLGATREVASRGGIIPLVRLIEDGSERAVEAVLSVLYSLSMESENHPALLDAGLAPVLKKFVLSERPHWMKALLLLRNLPV